MTWKDRLLKLAALVLTISFSCVWFSLIFFPERNDPLVFFLFLSTVSGGLLGLDKLFAGESSGRGRRGNSSSVTDRYLDDDRLMELEGHENRLADLEARLEFAERLLANQEREMMSPPSTAGDRFNTESRPAYRNPQRTPRP
jgi:hypothetical protein